MIFAKKNLLKMFRGSKKGPILAKRLKIGHFDPFFEHFGQYQSYFWSLWEFYNKVFFAKIILGISIVSLGVLVENFSSPWDHSGPI